MTKENKTIQSLLEKFKVLRLKQNIRDEDETIKLEQDRVFHTCHLLPSSEGYFDSLLD